LNAENSSYKKKQPFADIDLGLWRIFCWIEGRDDVSLTCAAEEKPKELQVEIAATKPGNTTQEGNNSISVMRTI
jgi:hypothetical protein